MDETKRCPYCGEEILAVAVKCKHCGSAIEGPAVTVKKQFGMRKPFKIAAVVIVALFAAGVIVNINAGRSLFGGGFSDADIDQVKKDIRAKLGENAGANVIDVQMMKESPKKLMGLVKVKVPILGVISKSCSATMGEESQYIWECH